MRARARVALVSIALSASFGLGGCAAIDDLKASLSRWFDTANVPDEGVGLPGTAPESPVVVAPEKIPKESSRPPKKKIKTARAESADRCASSQETTDLRFPPDGKAGRNRGAIRAARFYAIAHSVSRSATARNFFALRSAPNIHPKRCLLNLRSLEARAVEA